MHIRPGEDLQCRQVLPAQRQQLLPREDAISPVPPVGIRCIVHQNRLKILCADTPIHTEVTDEEARAGLTVEVGAEPRGGQLSHTCIHERESSPPLNPPPHQRHILRPLQPLHPKRPPELEQPVPPLQAHKPKKIPKNQLVIDPIRRPRLPPLLFKLRHLGLHRARGHAAKSQPGAQAGGGVDCVALARVHAVTRANVQRGAAGGDVVR
mmetsp:Transcript_72609/g.193678  ORF Transcript_72609/g.193678 Transcript_72609/m.193678 type:complete len:209 (-) Transcript_72609:748-1374(-)